MCSFYYEPSRICIRCRARGAEALRSYLKLTCEYELHTLSNVKVGATKDHGENYMNVRQQLVRRLLRNCLLSKKFLPIADGSTYIDSKVLLNNMIWSRTVVIFISWQEYLIV